MATNFTTFTPIDAAPAFTTFTPLESPSDQDEEIKKREQARLVSQKQKQDQYALFLEAMGDPNEQLAAASVPPGFKSVLDTPATTEQQKQNRDRRLSYGAGPINQQTESAANLLRSGATGTQDQTVRRIAEVMEERGQPSFADVAARAKRPDVIRAERDAKADEFRSAGEWAADTLSNYSQGMVTLVELPLNIFAPGSSLSKSLRATQKALQAEESDVLKAQREILRERVQNEDGFFGKYFATVESLITNPALGLSEAVKQVPNFLAIVAAARLGGALTVASINTAGRVSPTIALGEAISGGAITARASAIGTKAGGITASGLMAGGDAAGNVYQTLTDPKKTPMSVWRTNPDFQKLVSEGKTPKQAIEEISTAKARLAAAITFPLGLLGFMGAESAFLAQAGTRAALQAVTPKGAAKLVGKEIGLEQIQEGGTQAGGNVVSQTVNPEQSLLEGVPEAMATAAVTSGPFAGAAVARQALQDQQIQADPFAEAEARRRLDVQSYDPSIIDPTLTARSKERDPGRRPDQLLNEQDGRIEPTLDDAALISQPPRLEDGTPAQDDVPGMATEGDIADIDSDITSDVVQADPNVTVTPVTLGINPSATPALPPPTKAAESIPETPTVPPASLPKLFEPPVGGHAVADFPVVQVPVADLKLSEDVPQFKAGATAKGVVDPLTGKFTQEGVAPIAVWRRLDGTMEVISGRHRLDLAQRSKTKFINAQVYDEAQGFTAADASTLDAELNIRDEQGKVKDYVNYFKNSRTDRETAESKGLLGRVKGKRGFAIANQGSDALITAINGDQIGDEAAYYIALNAPNDARLQSVGLQAIMDGKSMQAATNIMQAVKAMAAERDTTTDMFGFDDSLIKEAQEMAKIASKMQQSIASRLSAITGAAKNPAMAKAEGIDVRDPEAVKLRIDELKAQKAALENWSTSPELVAQIRAQRGVAAPQFELKAETPQETVDRESTQDTERRAAEEKNQADNEVDFFQLQPQTQEKPEAPTEDMFADEPGLSAEYQAALETSNRAIAAFKKVQEAYRKQEIGDDDYLAARKVYDKAVEDFDKAIKKEQGKADEQEVEQDQAAIDEQEAAAYEALQKQAEDEIDAGPIGQAMQRVESGDFETKAQVRAFVNKLEKNGILDDVEGAREGLSDREQSADDVLDTVLSLLDDARDNAVQERLDELENEQSELVEATKNETEFIEESTKDKLEAIAQDFMVGDMVRFGSIPGTVVGVEGDYVRMRPDSATSPKAYQRVPKSSLTIVARPDNTSTMSFSKEQDNKFGSEAGQLNANMGNLIQLLGANMYGSALADVTVKELLQNAFDAVKGAVADINSKGEKIKPLYKIGKIEIEIDQTNRTITIKDNARGMTPQIVRDAFFTIAGSDKSDLPPGQRSGGLGLAKLGFMMSAENIKLDTVRDGVRVTVDTTSVNISKNNFTIQKSPAPKDEHGTTVTVKIPEFYIDPKNGDQRSIYFPYSQRSINALNQPLIGPVEVTFKDEYSEPVVLPIGVNFAGKDYSKFKANFDWGTADIFFGIARKSDRYETKHKVLSAGVYQFSPDFMLEDEKIPYDIVINISPNVDARHPDYPFVNSRENFKDRIKKDVEALQAYLGQIARGLEAKDLQESFKGVVSMPRMEAGQDIVDISDKLKKTFDKKKPEAPAAVRELPKEVTVTADTVTDTKTKKVLVDVKAKEQEKQKDASFKGSTTPKSADFMLDMKQDPKLPAFHNNTNVDYLEIGRQYGEPEKFFAELGTLVVEMKEDLAKSGMYGYSKLSPENLFFAGISIDKQYGGVHIRVPYKALFINPFYDFGARTLFGTRQNQLNTMIHEIAHIVTMDHGVAHNTQQIKVEQYLADEGLLDYYNDAILDILRRHESTFTAMKEAYDRSSTQNVAKSLEDYEKGSAAASARGDKDGTGDAPSAVSAREGQGRGEGVSRTQEDDTKQDRGTAGEASGQLDADKKLIKKYNRPVTPQLDPSPTKTVLVNSAKASKEFLKLAFTHPLDALGTAAYSVDRGIMFARNKNVWFGSGLNAADFTKYNGQLRTSQGLATASVALDNAIRGGQIAAEVIFQGGIRFDPMSLNFVATKKSKGMRGVYEAESQLKKKLGAQLGTDIIQGYLEAKRSRSIQNEFFERQANLEELKEQYKQLLESGASEKDIKVARDNLADARKEFNDIEVVFNKINMSDSEIDEFIARDQVYPELRKIMDNWSAINKNMLNFWRQVGLHSQKRYDALSNIQDYVPWQRIMNDESDIHSPVQATNRTMTNIGLERVFKKGTPTVITDFKAEKDQQVFKIQPAKILTVEVNGKTIDPADIKATPEGEVRLNVPIAKGDLVVFTASREIENIIDNMTRNVTRMTMNGLRQYAAQRIVSEHATRDANGKVMTFPKVDLERGRFSFIVNGRRVVVEIQDPLIAESIIGMETLGIAMYPLLAAAANITRRSITLSGIFQIKQVFKDAPTAALVTGVKNPLALIGGVYKGLVTSLLGLDPTINILKSAGIGGFQSSARTPEAEIKRRIGVMNRNVFDFIIKGLDHIGDSADMAQRVAIYNRVMAETGDQAQALYQAANVINFLHHGSGQTAQFVVKTVPFASAYANGMDVLFQAIAGGGLKGKTRKQNLVVFTKTATLLAMINLLYLFMVGDDEEYNQLDDETKLRNYMIPGTKILLPMNTNAAFIFKVIPELVYNTIIKEGTENEMDARRLRTALKEAAINALTGPTPIPSAVKPVIEIGINRDFFTSRPVVPNSLAKLDAVERYTAETSELGKMLSSLTGTDAKRILDPMEMDHFIRGIFGTTGAMVQWVSNSLAAASGERVAPTDKQAPLTGPFLRPDVPRRNEALFYDFKKLVDNKYGTYSKMVERADYDAADKYLDKHGDIIKSYEYTNELDTELKEINAMIRYYGESKETNLTPKERRAEIIDLQRLKQKILDSVIQFRKEAGL